MLVEQLYRGVPGSSRWGIKPAFPAKAICHLKSCFFSLFAWGNTARK
jgi:hypothetical protein